MVLMFPFLYASYVYTSASHSDRIMIIVPIFQITPSILLKKILNTPLSSCAPLLSVAFSVPLLVPSPSVRNASTRDLPRLVPPSSPVRQTWGVVLGVNGFSPLSPRLAPHFPLACGGRRLWLLETVRLLLLLLLVLPPQKRLFLGGPAIVLLFGAPG